MGIGCGCIVVWAAKLEKRIALYCIILVGLLWYMGVGLYCIMRTHLL